MSQPISRNRKTRRCSLEACGLEPLEPRHYLSADAVPLGADFRDGSAFMLGRVAVAVVLLDSDGRIDAASEQWSADEIATVRHEIEEGLNWWQDMLHTRFPQSPHDLTFIVDWTHVDQPAPTAFEPIRHSRAEDRYWINDFLQVADADTPASHLSDMARYNHRQRIALDTHWAFTVFVVDSSNDIDGRFRDQSFAYAHYGGPYLVMTYDNGGWGSAHMGQVLAHETAHIFHALDEYAGGDAYDRVSGYYGTPNHNAAAGHPRPAERAITLMGKATWQSSAYLAQSTSAESLAMIGWQDSDGDGVFDVLDIPPTLTGDGSYEADTGLYRFSGQVQAATRPNADPTGTGHAMTINTINRMQYRLDGGTWHDQVITSTYNSAVDLQVPVATPGKHVIELRAVTDATGLVSTTTYDSFTAISPPTGARPEPAGTAGHVSPPIPRHEPAASWGPAEVEGAIDARSGPLSMTDRDGTRVTFALRGPGSATIDRNTHGGLDIALDGTGTRTHLRIRADRGGNGRADLGTILVQRSLGSLEARAATLHGDIIVAGSVARLQLGTVIGPSLIDLGNGGGAIELMPTRVRLDDVTDLTMRTSVPITVLRAKNWHDADRTKDLLKAPALGQLRVAGDFEADLTLSGRGSSTTRRGAAATLNVARIGRDARGSTWSIRGVAGRAIGRFSAGGWLDAMDIRADGSVRSLTFGGIRGSDVAASAVGRLKIASRPRGAVSFVDTRITASHVGHARLGGVAPDNQGRTHGMTADTIGSYHRPGRREAVGPTSRFLDLSGDFAVRIA